jgi:LacI family transcriptional regulator
MHKSGAIKNLCRGTGSAGEVTKVARLTIVDLVELAAVSRGTVDRVLNNRPNVKPEIRKRVLNVIQETGYIPNRAALLLAANLKSKKIVILMPTSYGQHFRTEVTRGINQARQENEDYGLEILVEMCETGSPNEYLEKIDDLIEQGVAGFAICARNTITLQEKINELADRSIPVITFNSDIPESKRICFIGQNHGKSGRIAAEIMSKCINEQDKILIVTGNLEYFAHNSRVNGFCERFKELGLDPERYQVIECYQEYAITFDKIAQIIANNNQVRAIYMATESVQACAEAIKRARKPFKIKVVCHDVPESTAVLLKQNYVDFAIEQNMFTQGYKPIILLRDILFMKLKQDNELEYTPINIVNAESLDTL